MVRFTVTAEVDLIGDNQTGDDLIANNTGGNVTQAAEALGLSRGALYRRMEKYGL